MPKKMSGRLVALSASAVATIYLAGLLSTQPSTVVASPSEVATTNTAGSASAPSVVVGASASAVPSVVVGASAGAVPNTASSTAAPVATAGAATATSASPATSAVASTYADGTFSGTGTSRFGNVTVAVTTAAGKIANVQITRVTTSYPVARIASLPAQVIQKQTANVNTVSGATYSSTAFKQAVQQALTQALAASTQG